jgi:hypothetical protein
MKRIVVLGCLPLLVFLAGLSPAADRAEKKTPKQALQALNDLIGNRLILRSLRLPLPEHHCSQSNAEHWARPRLRSGAPAWHCRFCPRSLPGFRRVGPQKVRLEPDVLADIGSPSFTVVEILELLNGNINVVNRAECPRARNLTR